LAQAQLPTEQKGVELPNPPLNEARRPKEDLPLANLERRLREVEQQVQMLRGELEAIRRSANPLVTTPAGKTEIKVFSLRNLDAGEVAVTLEHLFAERIAAKALSIATHFGTNSLLAQGGPEDLNAVGAVIARLEEQPVYKKKVDYQKKGNYENEKK
jgi:hypothetical protein